MPVCRHRELAMRRRSVVTTIALGTTVLGAGALGVAVTAGEAEARLDIYVDKSAQRLSVIKGGALLYVWPVSTGRDRFSTPNGVYVPERLERSWFSKAYYNSPMPHAIFFHNGYAIHGSYDIMRLGGPASHGCVRLHPDNAALLFSMVEREGPGGAAIFVGGDDSAPPVATSTNRPLLQYRVVEVPSQPVLRRDDGAARNAYPPEPPSRGGPERHADAYPPAGPPPSPYYRGYVDSRGAWTAGPGAAPSYEAERRDTGRHDSARLDDGRGAPRGLRAEPYGDTDPYIEGRGAPSRSPYVPPDYNAGRYIDGRYADGSSVSRGPRLPSDYDGSYIDGRGAPRDARMQPPDYRLDHYADGRGAPYGRPLPRDYDSYLDGRGAPQVPNSQPYYAPDRHDARLGDRLDARLGDRYGERSRDGRTAEPRGPQAPPYATAERHVDGPDRRHGDNVDQNLMHGHAPASRPPALRADGNATGERALRNGPQPLTASAKPAPGFDPRSNPGAGANPAAKQGPNPAGPSPGTNSGGRPGAAIGATDELPGRRLTTSQAGRASAPVASAPQPATPARPTGRVEPERSPPEVGYRVLPPSYWAGASWRWRLKRDDDGPREPR
jgi:hypothetical protein